MAKRLTSIFTDNMDECIFTGSYEVERHHVFGGSNRSRCEVYGYVVPLRKDFHPNGVHFKKTIEMETILKVLGYPSIDNYLKCKCQEDYEEKHGTREQFIKEFGRSYL